MVNQYSEDKQSQECGKHNDNWTKSDPDVWEDPEKFDPERFRGPVKDTRHAFQFLPFGAGPRNCIGMRFALMEVKMALVKILMKFKFVASPETQVPLKIRAGLTLSAKDGVLVRVRSAS